MIYCSPRSGSHTDELEVGKAERVESRAGGSGVGETAGREALSEQTGVSEVTVGKIEGRVHSHVVELLKHSRDDGGDASDEDGETVEGVRRGQRLSSSR